MSITSKHQNKSIRFLKTLIFLLFLNYYSVSFSQTDKEKGKIETKILWAESYIGHYSDNNGNMFKGYGGLVEYITPMDTISCKNYLIGYYEIEKNSFRNISTYKKISDKEYLSNFNLMSLIWNNSKQTGENRKIKFNNLWEYLLCTVTYEKHFVGHIEQFIPDFNSYDDEILKYSKIKIPTYVIRIISIEPYKVERE